MRNYISELRDMGYTLEDISKSSGINKTKLSRLSSGKIPLKSGTSEYEKIRNISRRLAYKKARESGLTSDEATRMRRTLPDPEAITEKTSLRIVKHKEKTTRFQLRIKGLFYNLKTKDRKILEGFSNASLKINKKKMQAEAINNAQGQAGDSNWKLQRIIESELIQYKIGN